MSRFAPQIASLTNDLQLRVARDPETRLRILTIRGMLEINYGAGLATKPGPRLANSHENSITHAGVESARLGRDRSVSAWRN